MSINSPILLDTHVWVWLMNGNQTLKKTHRQRIEQAAAKGNLLIAAISVWEVGMLVAKGRIQLNQTCHQWVNQALACPGVTLVPLYPAIALESSFLPHQFHGDPADRILVATARSEGATLATRDQKILDYGRQGQLQTLAI